MKMTESWLKNLKLQTTAWYENNKAYVSVDFNGEKFAKIINVDGQIMVPRMLLVHARTGDVCTQLQVFQASNGRETTSKEHYFLDYMLTTS